MGIVQKLFAHALQSLVGGGVTTAVDWLSEYSSDHSNRLAKALENANDRAWKALEVALAGESLWSRLDRTEDKVFRQQIQAFLETTSVGGISATDPSFRQQCLKELRDAKTHLSGKSDPTQLAKQLQSLARFSDPQQILNADRQTVAGIGEELRQAGYSNLASLLAQTSQHGKSLLAVGVRYFFRREVEEDPKLAQGLSIVQWEEIAQGQKAGFDSLSCAFAQQGERIEAILADTHFLVTETHGAVLDIRAEQERLGHLHLAKSDAILSMMEEVQRRLSQNGMHNVEVRPHHSFSIRNDDERRAVKQLLTRFRQLPPNEQKQLPALLNGLGRLQIGTGDFEDARQTFVKVADAVTDSASQAEAHHNAFRAALEAKKWDEALIEIQKAAELDGTRFFPLANYRPKRILGAGGFGTAFLCEDNAQNEVVVKILQTSDLDRSMTEVFREAHYLRNLSHPAIIKVHDEGYADLVKKACPYIVMEYFSGCSLQAFVKDGGPLFCNDFLKVARQIVAGMRAAHQQNVLHRDLKPDNVLIHKEGDAWNVKIIDFGLALGVQAIETSQAIQSSADTLLGLTVAGTLKYAPPEQLGEMAGVKPGQYSDVYSFGKLSCYALFNTPDPILRHWSLIPEKLAEVLGKCIEREVKHRFSGFDEILEIIESIDRKIFIDAPGEWYDIENRENIIDTPASLDIESGRSYGFRLRTTAEDHDVKRLIPFALLDNFHKLDLGGCANLSNASLSYLERFGYLKELDLSSCEKMTGAGLVHLAKFRQLEKLWLENWEQLTDGGLAEVKTLTNLRGLFLTGCVGVTGVGLCNLAHLKHLSWLALRDCTALTDASLSDLHDRKEFLLDLDGCVLLTDVGLSNLQQLAGLWGLCLSNCTGIAEAGLVHLRHLKKLERLWLNNWSQLTDRGLAYITNLGSLKWLILDNCEHITDSGLSQLNGMDNLEHLVLSRCGQLTNRATAAFKGLKRLTTLNLLDCHGITDEAVAALRGVPTLRTITSPAGAQISLGTVSKDGVSLSEGQRDVPRRRTSEKEAKIGRNDACPCGSGKKFKKCCINKRLV